MKRVKPSLPAPPLKAFLVRVEGNPGPKLQFEADFAVTGFYRLLGMTVRDESEFVALAREELARDGSTLVQVDEVRVPDFGGKDADIADVVDDPRTPGLWYKSGHAYFGDDDDA